MKADLTLPEVRAAIDRVCNRCNKGFVSTPYKIKRSINVCNNCLNVYRRQNYKDRKESGNPIKARYYPEKAKAYNAEYYSNPEKRRLQNESTKKLYRKDPHKKVKMLANKAVLLALRKGALNKQPCEVCGEEKVEGHHDDYSQRLSVRWLCIKHHREFHKTHIRDGKIYKKK